MHAENMARWERKLRPLLSMLPPRLAVLGYSTGRLEFLVRLRAELPVEPYIPPEHLARTLWGIRFRSPIMNAAGMFKNGECYRMAALQGAAAFMGGTGTWNGRDGNTGKGIYLPFVPYPSSGSASNWLGLPNDGDESNSRKAACLERIADTPVGWSVMGSPDLQGAKRASHLVKGMRRYEYAGVDFIEINESCPNTAHGKPQDTELVDRLGYVKEGFLDRRTISETSRLREVPVIVKFSNDTDVKQLPALLDILFDLGYDGVNFGNASTAYTLMRERIHPAERRRFDWYTNSFGGGVSGRPLKEKSLELASRAAAYVRAGAPSQEFHVIRTGGIETWQDIQESTRAGIPLNGWLTGYFERFAEHGHNVYRDLFTDA